MDTNLENSVDKSEEPSENSSSSGKPTAQSTSQPYESNVNRKPSGSFSYSNKKDGSTVWVIVIVAVVVLIALCELVPYILAIAAMLKYLTTSGLSLPFI